MNEFENGCDIARQGAVSGNTEAYEAGAGSRAQVGSVRGRVGRPPGRSASTMIVSCWLTGIGATSRTATGIWTMEAIRADVAARSLPFEVAVENLDHDFNIGSIVRTANAMGARRVHVVGRKRWNRRGAMVTDRYLPVDHCAEVRELVDHCSREGLSLVGVDNVEGSVALEGALLPERACLVFRVRGLGPQRGDAGRLPGRRRHHSTRFHALHERRPCRRHCHVGARHAFRSAQPGLTMSRFRHFLWVFIELRSKWNLTIGIVFEQ